MDKVIKKKSKCYGSYEEFVFGENSIAHHKPGSKSNLDIYIGSRPFETKKSFFEFLDQFYAVSFSKVYDAMAEKDRTASLPFLQGFAKEIVDREMTVFIERVNRGNALGRRGLSILSSPMGPSATEYNRACAGEQDRVAGPIRTHTRERSVPGRTSNRLMTRLVEEEEERHRSRSSSSRPVGLFRGKSTTEIVSPERRHATVKRLVLGCLKKKINQ